MNILRKEVKNLRKKISKPISVVIVTFLIGSLFVGSAFAAAPTNNHKPGWGFGDHHHHHTGPPGQSNRPSDRFGDDGHGRKDFYNFFSNVFNFFRHHGFPNA